MMLDYLKDQLVKHTSNNILEDIPQSMKDQGKEVDEADQLDN